MKKPRYKSTFITLSILAALGSFAVGLYEAGALWFVLAQLIAIEKRLM